MLAENFAWWRLAISGMCQSSRQFAGIKGTVTVIQRRAQQNSACVVNYGHCPFNSGELPPTVALRSLFSVLSDNVRPMSAEFAQIKVIGVTINAPSIRHTAGRMDCGELNTEAD